LWIRLQMVGGGGCRLHSGLHIACERSVSRDYSERGSHGGGW